MPDSLMHGLNQGTTLAGRYVVMQHQGQGSMGTIYQAMDLQSNRMVALKHLNLPSHLSPEDCENRIQRFQNEASVVGLLDHPHIMGFHEIFELEGEHYMALELLQGPTLDEYAPVLKQSPGKMLTLIDQIADALEYIHARGVVHLDLKPENVLVVDGGQNVKLLDFGISRIEGMDTPISRNALVGTVSYMSPEQLQNSRLTSSQSDMYSLGVMMYELFTGQLPYEADNHGSAILMVMNHEPVAPIQLNPMIGEDLQQLILTCMHKLPQHRFANCRQLRKLIQVLLRKTFHPQAPPQASQQRILPNIRMFAEFSLVYDVSDLIDEHATGQYLLWNSEQEAGIWLQNGNVLYADIKNKSLDPEAAFLDVMSWESGNYLFIPNAALPAQAPTIKKNAYDLISLAHEHLRTFKDLWDMYQEHDLPEIVMMPGAGDQLSEVIMNLLEMLDGNWSVGKLHATYPYSRMEILSALKEMDDRQFLFVDRIR